MPLDVCMQAQSQLENHYSTYEQRTLSYHLPFVSNQRLITKQTSPVCVCVRVCVAPCMVTLKRSPNKCFIYKIKTEKTLICKHWWCYQRLAEDLIMNQCQTGDLSRVHPACRHMAAGLPPPPKYWWHQRDITWLKWKWIQFGFFNEWYETVSFGIKFGNIFDLFNDPRFSYKLLAANYQTSSRLPFFVNMICNLFFHLDQREICLKKNQSPAAKINQEQIKWKHQRDSSGATNLTDLLKRDVRCVSVYFVTCFFCAKREQNDWQFKCTFGYNAFVATSSTHPELWPQIQHCLLPPHSLPSLLKTSLVLKDISVTLVEIAVKPFQLTPLLFISIFNLWKHLLTSKHSSGNRESEGMYINPI